MACIPQVVERSHHQRILSVDEDLEQKIWSELQPYQWEKSITRGFFESLYIATVEEITSIKNRYDITCILEVGCGTGQVIGKFSTKNQDVKCIGIDINPEFIQYCSNKLEYAPGNVDFEVANATKLAQWATTNQDLNSKAGRNFLICVNNTMSIMPEEIRHEVIREMQKVAGKDGIVLVTYWNGNYFRQGVEEYYAKNSQLCGNFDLEKQDYVNRKLLTDTGYTSHWPTVNEVHAMFVGYLDDENDIISIQENDKGVFALIKGISSNESIPENQ